MRSSSRARERIGDCRCRQDLRWGAPPYPRLPSQLDTGCCHPLQENGIQIVAASEKAADIYTESELSLPLGLVLGAEDHGVSQDVLRRADKIVRIPQVGAIGSLNVSVAGGILIYEVVRQAGLGAE